MHSTTIAVDLAKSVFEVAVSQRPGKVAERHRLSRGQFSRFLAEQRAGDRGDGGLRHGALLGPRGAAAAAIAWCCCRRTRCAPTCCATRPMAPTPRACSRRCATTTIRPVPVKSVDQHVLAALHRLRSAWMATRTARLNTLRGLLRELGFSIPVGARQVVPHVGALVSDADSGLPDALRPVLAEAAREIRELEARMREVERSLETMARASDVVVRLRTIPGVGPAHRDGARRLRRRRAALPVRPPLRELPRAHAARVVERPAPTPRARSASAAIRTCACC